MFNLCIAELSEIVEGSVSLGSMPPLAGLFEPVGRIVVDVREVRDRDVLWIFDSECRRSFHQAEVAHARGVLGTILNRPIEPWAGKFCINVADSIASLHRLMRCVRAEDGSWPESLFGQDDVTRKMMTAVWQRDVEAVRRIVDQLDWQMLSAA